MRSVGELKKKIAWLETIPHPDFQVRVYNDDFQLLCQKHYGTPSLLNFERFKRVVQLEEECAKA